MIDKSVVALIMFVNAEIKEARFQVGGHGLKPMFTR